MWQDQESGKGDETDLWEHGHNSLTTPLPAELDVRDSSE